jgi:RNA polymerase sigma-70 factor (ECF subfamily)
MNQQRNELGGASAEQGMDLSRSGFEHLHDRYHEMLVWFFIRRSASQESARELAQDVWQAAWIGRAQFRGEAKIKTWLLSIAGNLWLKEDRRQKALKRKALETSQVEAEGILARTAASPDPVTVLEDRRQRDLLRQQIALLPSPTKECYQLRLYQGGSYDDIATKLGLSVGQVRDYLKAGKRRLRQILSLERQEL